MSIDYEELASVIVNLIAVEGNKLVVHFENIKPLDEADESSLIWIKPTVQKSAAIIENTPAKVILADSNTYLPDHLKESKCLLKVKNPKLELSRVINAFFVSKRKYVIHPTSTIDPEAEIAENVYIGPGSVIGRCVIESNTVIEANVTIHDNSIIKENVIIQAGSVIGTDGFGHSRNEKGELTHFPHIGRVIINKNVHLGSNVCIDRGVLGSTVIGEGTKINSLSFIAHNVQIGRNNLINPNVLFSGSAKVGDNNFIGTGANIRNKIKIGDNTTIGMGAVVVSDVKDNQVVIGNPAKEMKNRSNKPLY